MVHISERFFFLIVNRKFKNQRHQTAVSIPTVKIPPKSVFVAAGPWWYKADRSSRLRNCTAIRLPEQGLRTNLKKSFRAFGLSVLAFSSFNIQPQITLLFTSGHIIEL